MKKRLMLFWPVTVLLILALTLSGCVVSLTCISHIDSDLNGKCDHCGIEMEVPRQDIESIEVTQMPTKTYYARDEVVDVTGGVITVTYNDGKAAEEIPMTDEEVTINAPNMSLNGRKRVEVRYGGHSTNFIIEVGDARFTVSFELGYDGAAIEDQMVTQNNYATAPETPVREGYSFLGWFTDEAATQRFDFALTPITADLTLYAGWAQNYTITYDANYEGGRDFTAETVNGLADVSVRPDDRDGYTFAGWYADANCTTQFDPNTVITADTTLYAYWVSSSTEMYTVTFDYNYDNGDPDSFNGTTTEVPGGGTATAPATPERANVTEKGHQASGFTFEGWYTDAACTTAYDFGTPVNADMTLYAKWTGEYVFEAEHVDLSGPDGNGLQGMGASGGSVGPNMVDSVPTDSAYLNASNGYYVTYLYRQGLYIDFVIESDRAVDDATLVVRITAENSGYALDPVLNDGTTANGTQFSMYWIMLNEVSLDYETIEVAGGWPAFEDYTIAVNLSLKEGENVVRMMTANSHGMGGTMAGTAPVIDCIKITTSANLSWNPVTGNEFGQ